MKVAKEGLTLAENELNQARRRYEAGVANSIEVTDAQTRLERARDNRLRRCSTTMSRASILPRRAARFEA